MLLLCYLPLASSQIPDSQPGDMYTDNTGIYWMPGQQVFLRGNVQTHQESTHWAMLVGVPPWEYTDPLGMYSLGQVSRCSSLGVYRPTRKVLTGPCQQVFLPGSIQTHQESTQWDMLVGVPPWEYTDPLGKYSLGQVSRCSSMGVYRPIRKVLTGPCQQVFLRGNVQTHQESTHWLMLVGVPPWEYTDPLGKYSLGHVSRCSSLGVYRPTRKVLTGSCQ